MKKRLRNKRAVGMNQMMLCDEPLRKKNKVQTIVNYQLSIFLLMTFFIAACTNNVKETHETYTCPMHPTVVSDKPGTCPVCGMDLVRKAKPGEEVKITEELSRLTKSPNETVIASIGTVHGKFESKSIPIVINGIVTYDTRNINTISSRIGGRLEKVYLKYDFQPVQKGQKVAEIYSPELVNAQREFLYLMERESHHQELIEAAKNKLSLLGATQKQIDQLLKTKEISYIFPIYSPYSGYIISKDQQASPIMEIPTLKSSSGMGMTSTEQATAQPAISTTKNSSLIRTGNYVNAGEEIFKIVNTSSLWIEFNLATSLSPYLKTGTPLEWEVANKKQQSKVDFIEPFTDNNNFVKVRSYVNSHELFIGQLISAKILITTSESMWLPREAVLDLGQQEIAFVKTRNQFKPTSVETGIKTDEVVQIIKGITSGDEVAKNAQYLVDSDSFIKSEK